MRDVPLDAGGGIVPDWSLLSEQEVQAAAAHQQDDAWLAKQYRMLQARTLLAWWEEQQHHDVRSGRTSGAPPGADALTTPCTSAADRPTRAQRVTLLVPPRGTAWGWLCCCGLHGRPFDTQAGAFADWEAHRVRCVLRPADREG